MLFENIVFVTAGKLSTGGGWMHPVQKNGTERLLYVTRGELYICEDYKRYTLRAGDVLVIPKGVKHYGYQPSEGEVSFYWMNFGYGKEQLPSKMKVETGEMAVSLFENLLYFANTPEYLSDAANYAARLLLVELYVRNSVSESGSPSLVSDICGYIKANAGKNIMVRDVAAEFSVSEGHITRLFNKYYSMGLKNYIDLIRMEHIKKLLASDGLPLKDVAERSGFDDYDAFLKFFKYREKISPSRFRELV